MEYKLELASIGDIDSVLELYSERIKWFKDNSIKQWTNYLDNNPKSVFIEKITNKEYYVVKNNNKIIAGFELSTNRKGWTDTTPAYYICKLVTKVGYKNIGGFIFKECEKMAIKNGKKYLRLDCIKKNKKLNDIYKGHGFKFMGYGRNEQYGYDYVSWEYKIDK